MLFLKNKASIAGASLLLLFSLPAWSASVQQAIQVQTATHQAAAKSQQKINRLDDQTQKMLNQYRSAIHQTKSLKTYNKYLQDMLKSQQEEQASLQEQLQNIETTQQEIVPLLLRMMDSLEKFVQLDIPFLPQERQQRLTNLKKMLHQANITNAEKYRRILEAFQIENDYGKTIEAYRADLNLKGKTSSVDFLRLGRVSLYFQRLDGSESGYWDKQQKQWIILDNSYRSVIRKGLRIARKEMAPDLLTLPIPAAEAAQ